MGETLCEHAGEDEGLHRLDEIFYAKALADPVLKELFTHRVATHVEHLTWFTEEQRERFVRADLEALNEAEMPADSPFRQAFREHVEFGAKVAQQNSRATSDEELYPLHAVPHWDWPR
jgi:hemoglobin